jgi:hypothetical protein
MSKEITEQEAALIDHFANFFLQVILDGELKFSDATDDLEITVTQEFLTELRKILNET